MKNRNYYLGSHVSMSAKNDYLIGSVKEAISYNSNTFMIYTGAPQNTKRTETSKLNISQFHTLVKENGFDLEKLVVHGPYTINLANTIKPDTYNLGVRLLVEELQRVEEIGIRHLVLHPGAAVGADKMTALQSIVKGLDEVFDQVPNTKVKLSLETMSGKGTEVCTSFEDIQYVLNNIKHKDKVGVCFDTCHMSDAGYDIVNNFEKVLEEFEQKIGLDKLWVIHLNDSKNAINSHKDRHANIGYGFIGFEPLCDIVHNPKFKHIPIILETPYINDVPPYKEEIEMIDNKKFTEPFKMEKQYKED